MAILTLKRMFLLNFKPLCIVLFFPLCFFSPVFSFAVCSRAFQESSPSLPPYAELVKILIRKNITSESKWREEKAKSAELQVFNEDLPSMYRKEWEGWESIREKINNHSRIRRQIAKAEPAVLAEKLSEIPPEYARFFTADKLMPGYDGPFAPRKNLNRNRKTIKHQAILTHLTPQKVKRLNEEDSAYNNEHGLLRHLSPEHIPHLTPKVIEGLNNYIIYISDKVQYMTKKQIEALSSLQIFILRTSLYDTGKNAELSQKQTSKFINTYPGEIMFLRAPANNRIITSYFIRGVARRDFPIKDIPVDIMSLIPTTEFSSHFLNTLRKRSYKHFLAISPEQINNMPLALQEYIVKERWQSLLRTPQKKLALRNLSVKKVKDMDESNRQEILTQLNLSEELFMIHQSFL